MFILTVIYICIPPGRYVQMSFKQTKGQNALHKDSTSEAEAHALQETA